MPHTLFCEQIYNTTKENISRGNLNLDRSWSFDLSYCLWTKSEDKRSLHQRPKHTTFSVKCFVNYWIYANDQAWIKHYSIIYLQYFKIDTHHLLRYPHNTFHDTYFIPFPFISKITLSALTIPKASHITVSKEQDSHKVPGGSFRLASSGATKHSNTQRRTILKESQNTRPGCHGGVQT